MNTSSGSMNIFVHGIMQNRFFFEKTMKLLKNESKKKDVVDIGVITFRKNIDGSLCEKVNDPYFSDALEFARESLEASLNKEFKRLEEPVFLPSNEFIKLTTSMDEQTVKSKIKLLMQQGYHLGLRYEGSEILESTLDMKKELRKVVRNMIPSDIKYNMIGHSRGGLACLSYAMTYSQDVNKVITLGTPYAGSSLAKPFGNNILAEKLIKSERMSMKELSGETPFLKNLQEEWDKEGKYKVDLTAIGMSNGLGSDGIVDIRSQLAFHKGETREYKNVKRIRINSNLQDAFHNNEAINPTVIHLLNTMIREDKKINHIEEKVDSKVKPLLDRLKLERLHSIEDISERVLRPRLKRAKH